MFSHDRNINSLLALFQEKVCHPWQKHKLACIPAKTSFGSLCTSAKTWHVHSNMLGAQHMLVPGGPVLKRPAWTKTITHWSIQAFHEWLSRWSSWSELGTRGVPSVVVRNVTDLKPKKISGFAALGLFMVERG
jgi:hypothetical protein